MGMILILFMFFISSGIYFFTRYIFEDGTKKLMQAEAVKLYSYSNSLNSDLSLLNDRYYLFTINPKIAFMGNDRLEANYIVYSGNIDESIIDNDKDNIIDSINNLAEDAFEEKKDSYVVRKIGGINYRIYTKYFINALNPRVVQIYQNTINEEIIWSFLKSVVFSIGSVGMFILLAISYLSTGKALKPVKEAWIKQKEFVADASHELRTPLTVIQTNLDVVLSNSEGSFEENEIWLDNAYSETRVMAKLIDHLLLLAKADSKDQKLDISDFSLSEMVDSICANMENIARKKNIEIELNLEENIFIKGDYDKVRRMIVILVDNAIKYTEKGKVTVSLLIEKNKKILTVEDTGIGINKRDIDRIFDRFYRADKARHREGGSGIGLSIAKWIADIHRFSLTVESEVDKGSKFTVRF
jgi:signal transduction histidine kinase